MYDVSGGKAWEELHSYETSGATEELNGESLSLTELRNLAYDHGWQRCERLHTRRSSSAMRR